MKCSNTGVPTQFCTCVKCQKPVTHYTPSAVLDRYIKHYDGEIQGCCPVIADEIQRAIGGEVVAGYLCFNGVRRSHWWVEHEGVVIDPMGDWMLRGDYFTREEAHRDRSIFESILPDYERWRV